MLHQTGGFRGQAICRCHWNLRQTDPGCHGNENLGILTEKMAKTRLIQEIEPQKLHQMGFSRSGNLPLSLKFISDRPRLPWQRKFGNFR